MQRACNRLNDGKHQFDQSHYPESVSSFQESMEFSIKAIFHFAGVKYPPEHEVFPENFRRILKNLLECEKKHSGRRLAIVQSSIHMPRPDIIEYGGMMRNVFKTEDAERLFMISELWTSVYLTAKYGNEKAGIGSSEKLFRRKEATLALEHAYECYRVAYDVYYYCCGVIEYWEKYLRYKPINRT